MNPTYTPNSPQTPNAGTGKIDHLVEKAESATQSAANTAEQAISSTRRAANGALDTLHDSVEHLREEVPGAISRAAAQADQLARRGIDKARQASAEVRERVHVAGEHTVSYIKDEPVKSVLMAAAAGALLAALIGLVARSDRR